MTIGLGQGKVFVASEPAAFNRYTKNFIAMQDGEIGVVAADGTSLDLSRIEVAPNLNIESSPAPYPHWTIKVREPHCTASLASLPARRYIDSALILPFR